MTSRSHRYLAAFVLGGLVATTSLTPAGPTLAAVQTAPAAVPLSPEALHQDFAVLRAVLTEIHPSTDRYISPAALTAALDAAGARLDRPMTDRELLATAAPAINVIRDGHTVLTLSDASDTALRETALTPPFTVHVSQGRLFVHRDLAPMGGSDLSGREIAAINGRSAAELIAEMSAMTPADGVGATLLPYRLSNGLRFNRLHGLLHGSSDRYEVRLAGEGAPREVVRPGRTVAALDQAWRERFPGDRAARPPLELGFQDEGRIAVLTVSAFAQFTDDTRAKTVAAAIGEAFDAIRDQGARVVILDLRDNGGGRDELGRVLFAHIADRSFDYYRGLYAKTLEPWSFAAHSRPPGPVPPTLVERDAQGRLALIRHPNLGRHEPTANRFAGRVIILMNGGSFSTTAEFLSIAHNARRAVFVGEEGGGGYYGDSSASPAATVTLPNSGLVLYAPLLRYEMAVDGFAPADRGVPPHYEVIPTVRDRLAGRDPVMERALDIARSRPDRDSMDPETAP